MVQCLLEHGVDVNKAATDHYLTPLHIAVEEGHIDVAVCLMEHGMADLNARTRYGQRPMDFARNEDMKEVIVNEEKRRRDHGFKRSMISSYPTTDAEEESNDNDDEDSDSDSDSDSSGEEDATC